MVAVCEFKSKAAPDSEFSTYLSVEPLSQQKDSALNVPQKDKFTAETPTESSNQAEFEANLFGFLYITHFISFQADWVTRVFHQRKYKILFSVNKTQ